MCDYSLMGVPNRLAREGEVLVVHRFRTGTLGLACPSDLTQNPAPKGVRDRGFWPLVKEFFSPPERKSVAAVCVPPGASLMLRDIPVNMQKKFGVGPDEQVIFTQLSARPDEYRDAIRFTCGREVRLQELREGQRVEILDLEISEGVRQQGSVWLELPA